MEKTEDLIHKDKILTESYNTNIGKCVYNVRVLHRWNCFLRDVGNATSRTG